MGSLKYIYADLVDKNTGEIWEIKPDAPKYYVSGPQQLQKYIDAVKALGGVGAVPGASLGSETFYHISMGKLTMIPSVYKVSYTSNSAGMIYYKYETKLDVDLLAVAAALMAAGIFSGQFSIGQFEGIFA